MSLSPFHDDHKQLWTRTNISTLSWTNTLPALREPFVYSVANSEFLSKGGRVAKKVSELLVTPFATGTLISENFHPNELETGIFASNRIKKGSEECFMTKRTIFWVKKRCGIAPPSALRENSVFWRAPLKALQVLRSLVDSALICPLSWQSTCRVWQGGAQCILQQQYSQLMQICSHFNCFLHHWTVTWARFFHFY